MINKINKKVIFLILMIILVLVAILIYVITTKNEESVLRVYETNEYGLMRDTEMISDEIFDNYGNLTYYKYKMKLEDGSTVEKTYDIKYTFDLDNRITRVAYDNNYIEIAYNSDNKISNLINQIDYDDYKNKVEYNFNYEDTVTKVASKRYNIYDDNNAINLAESYITQENYTITETIINNEKYIRCIIINEELSKEEEYLYKIQDKEINYSNIFSLLNVAFDGYFSYDNNMLYNNFNINIPVFYEGKFIYLKSNSNSSFSNNTYYDEYDRILKIELVSNNSKFYNETYCMYKNVNDKVYYKYLINSSKDANGTAFNYIKDKVYSNNNVIYKVENLENKTLTEKEYQDKVKDFIKYQTTEICDRDGY